MHNYDSVLEALDGLAARGFDLNFNIEKDHLACKEEDIYWHPEHFEIIEVYRFEGDTNPADQAVVYAIASDDGQKGVFVNSYGIYSENMSDDLLKKIKIHH